MSELNIYQRINKIMSEIGYIKRGSAGQGTGVLYDEVIADLQPLLVKYGVVVCVDFISDSSRKNAKDSYIYEACFDVHYINIDKTGDRHTSRVVSHSMDAGDKAPGKAITYAAKTVHLKTFGYETGVNDESRSEEKDVLVITEEQVKTLWPYLVDDKGYFTKLGSTCSIAFGFKSVSEIKASKYEKVLKQCKS
ncbi:MAG: ERF family protein [Candidatus Bathyarchaeia archaeon]